jgi:hypothetical protein
MTLASTSYCAAQFGQISRIPFLTLRPSIADLAILLRML